MDESQPLHLGRLGRTRSYRGSGVVRGIAIHESTSRPDRVDCHADRRTHVVSCGQAKLVGSRGRRRQLDGDLLQSQLARSGRHARHHHGLCRCVCPPAFTWGALPYSPCFICRRIGRSQRRRLRPQWVKHIDCGNGRSWNCLRGMGDHRAMAPRDQRPSVGHPARRLPGIRGAHTSGCLGGFSVPDNHRWLVRQGRFLQRSFGIVALQLDGLLGSTIRRLGMACSMVDP